MKKADLGLGTIVGLIIILTSTLFIILWLTGLLPALFGETTSLLNKYMQTPEEEKEFAEQLDAIPPNVETFYRSVIQAFENPTIQENCLIKYFDWQKDQESTLLYDANEWKIRFFSTPGKGTYMQLMKGNEPIPERRYFFENKKLCVVGGDRSHQAGIDAAQVFLNKFLRGTGSTEGNAYIEVDRLDISESKGASGYPILSFDGTTQDLWMADHGLLYKVDNEHLCFIGTGTRPWYHVITFDYECKMVDYSFPSECMEYAVLTWPKNFPGYNTVYC